LIKTNFNDEKKEFTTLAYDEIKNECLIHLNQQDSKSNKWIFQIIKLDLKLLEITKEPLKLNDCLEMTSKANLIVILKDSWLFYVDYMHQKIVFKTDLSNTSDSIDLKKEFEFDKIKNTNDLIGLDKSFKKLVYFNLFIDEESSNLSVKKLKLKLFASDPEDSDFLKMKVKKNLLFVLKRKNYRIVVYDLNNVKKHGCFSNKSIVFENDFYDRRLLFDVSVHCNYLIIFQNPRRLLVYRISDFNLIGEVPILCAGVKEIVANFRFISLILTNNDLLTLMVIDHKKDPEFSNEQLNALKFR
jgi:hypothetical protein